MSALMLCLLIAACATLNRAAEPQPLTAQFLTHCAPLKMPVESQRRGESGRVRLAIRLAPDGMVASARVSRSSGFSTLDQAVLTNVRACRFEAPGGTAANPAESELQVRFAFDVRAWFPLEGAAETAQLEHFVSDANRRCEERVTIFAEHIRGEAANWHARNDAIARLVLDYKQQYYGDIRQYAAKENPQLAIERLEGYLQSKLERAASEGQIGFDALSDLQRQTYCQRHVDRVSTGALDLMSVVIQFPELEFFIRERTPAVETR